MSKRLIIVFSFIIFFASSLMARPMNAFDSIAKELVRDFDYDEKITVVVGGFEADLSRHERKQIEQELQVSLFRTKKVEVIEASKTDENLQGIDYLCTGTIAKRRSSYLVTAKLIDVETGKLENVSSREVSKNDVYDDYYDDDDNDDWEKIFWAHVLFEAARPKRVYITPPAPKVEVRPARPAAPSRRGSDRNPPRFGSSIE